MSKKSTERRGNGLPKSGQKTRRICNHLIEFREADGIITRVERNKKSHILLNLRLLFMTLI